MMKNEIVTLQITDINPDGNGVSRTAAGLVVFTPLTAPGDTARVRIIKETKSYAIGKMEELLTPSSDRIDPDCSTYKRCGGCVYRHLSFDAENKLKKQTVENAMKRIGHLDCKVEDTVCFEMERYRNKVAYPLSGGTFGYYARHTHAIVEHETCPLQDDLFTKIALFHVKQSEKHHIPMWNEKSGAGILRHLLMRKNRKGEYMVCFVASKRFDKAVLLATELMQAFPEIIGISLNINPTSGNVILGNETICLAGESVLHDELCGKMFEISPTAFYQVNADCAEAMYQKAAELAELPDGGVLLDLYCGAGTIGLSMIKDNQKLCGVEIIPDAIKNAWKNAENNGRNQENTLFVCGDASIGVEHCRKTFGEPDVIVVDPPRKGLSKEVIDTLLDVAPERIVYISCNPATLAGNCADLCKELYAIDQVIPYNMFPRTGHVESVVLLKRRCYDIS